MSALFGARSGRLFAPAHAAPSRAPMHRRSGVALVQPIGVAPGMQALTASLPMTYGSCEDFGCEWWMFGKVGFDAGQPFEHPAGVECGDFDRCTDPNCPCPSRVLQWPERLANGKLRRYGHPMPDQDAPARYRVTTRESQRLVDFGEYVDRTHEGIDTLTRILTRGL